MFNFDAFYEAKSLDEALNLLSLHPKATIISGGTDVLIKLHEGKLEGVELLSIHSVSELKGIRMEQDGSIVIGAASTFVQIAASPIIQQNIPVLGEAVETVGGPQIRNVGTIGGNLSNGVTSADSASTCFALNAKLKLQSQSNTRIIPVQDYYLGPGKVDLQPGELLTEIIIYPEDYEGFGGCYIKYAMRGAMDIATLGCSCLCKLTADSIIEDFRLAFGVAGPTPLRCPNTEALVKGNAFSEKLLEDVGNNVLGEVNPRTSWRASKEFRLQLIEELSKRAFRKAVQRAGGTY